MNKSVAYLMESQKALSQVNNDDETSHWHLLWIGNWYTKPRWTGIVHF